MDINELIRMFILDVIADDYENLEKIQTEVKDFACRSGLKIGDGDVARELANLIDGGLARAYRLSTTAPVREMSGTPPAADLNRYYYWLTEAGRDVQMAECPAWPFNDDGSLRGDWPTIKKSLLGTEDIGGPA